MIDSLKKNKKGIILMIFSSVLVCFGQLMWKLSSRGLQYLIIGFILYGVGALIMLIAYKYGSLSVLQPCLSLNYALSIFLGVWVLGESLSLMKIIGIIIIIIGVIMIGGGDE
ncbi:EamA/RhaT family transporter [Coprobacillus sp. AM42-12AC]|nr:membrane protein [Coprobacillus sp. 8_1_38FAA]RHB05468.1 EamA/RhaT family transporter [Coprobacillus sp. AM42-12AC]